MGIVKHLSLLAIVSQRITKREYDVLLKHMDVILKNVNKKEEERKENRSVMLKGDRKSILMRRDMKSVKRRNKSIKVE